MFLFTKVSIWTIPSLIQSNRRILFGPSCLLGAGREASWGAHTDKCMCVLAGGGIHHHPLSYCRRPNQTLVCYAQIALQCSQSCFFMSAYCTFSHTWVLNMMYSAQHTSTEKEKMRTCCMHEKSCNYFIELASCSKPSVIRYAYLALYKLHCIICIIFDAQPSQAGTEIRAHQLLRARALDTSPRGKIRPWVFMLSVIKGWTACVGICKPNDGLKRPLPGSHIGWVHSA